MSYIYLLVTLLVIYILWELFVKPRKGENERYAEETPVDPYTHDDRSCEEMREEAPEVLEGPREGSKDNLTRIKGIGPKIEEKLNTIGIYHFDQIAAWTEENISWADNKLAFPGRCKREEWIEQATLLAEGRETEFSQRVDKGEVESSHT